MVRVFRLNKRAKFFFAEAAAGMYDPTIGLVVPHYELMHSFVLFLLRTALQENRGVILDVGSGTGTDSIAVLKELPKVHVVSMDLCSPIQRIHRQKLLQLDSPKLRLQARSTLICDDVTNFRSLPSLLNVSPRKRRFLAVISSLTIHHLRHSEKQRLYEMVHSVLLPGGVFINADLFSYADALISRKTLGFDLDWMRSAFLHPPLISKEAQRLPASRRRYLLKRWIHHYLHANHLEPLEDRPGAHGHLTMLQRAGFRSIEVPYRMSLSGILIARK
jgi:SAM-dependent methyltransferase